MMFRPDFTKANPYEGVPQSYLRQIQGTPAYEQALRAGWVKPPTTWKPDYTKSDPYEGAPPEYIELVKETFKPTVEHPLPPFTGRLVDADTSTFVDNTGHRMQIRTQEQAEFIGAGIDARAENISKNILDRDYVLLGDGQYMLKSDFNKLDKKYQDIAKSQGFDAYRAQLERDNVKLGDGSYYSKDAFNKLDKKYQDIAKSQGYDAMVVALKKAGYKIETDADRYQKWEKKAADILNRSIKRTDPQWEKKAAAVLARSFASEQNALKEQYNKDRKRSLVERLAWGSKVTRLEDGTYVPVVAGVAVTVGGGANPQQIMNIAKVIGAIGGGYLGAEGIKSVKNAYDEYQAQTKQAATLDNVVIINPADSKIIRLSEKDRTVQAEGFDLMQDSAKLEGMDLIDPKTHREGFSRVDPHIKEAFDFKPQDIAVVLDPRVTTPIKDAEDHYLKASSDFAKANLRFIENAERIRTQVSDPGRLQAIDAALRIARDQVKAYGVKDETAVVAMPPPVGGISRPGKRSKEAAGIGYAAYMDWLKSRERLINAWKSYVSSLEPTPVMGNVSKDALYTLAAYKLINYIKDNDKINYSDKAKLINQIQNQYAEQDRSAINDATNIREASRAAEATRTAELARTGELSQTSEIANTNDMTRTRELSLTARGVRIRLPDRDDDSDKDRDSDETVKVPPGTIAFEMGKLGRGQRKREVIKVIQPPYTKVKTLVGQQPTGYKNTGDTPKETIQVIGGPAKKNVSVRIGATTAHVQADKREIKFSSAGKETFNNGKVRIIESTEAVQKESRRGTRRRNKTLKARDLGAGVVRDRRGQHLRLD